MPPNPRIFKDPPDPGAKRPSVPLGNRVAVFVLVFALVAVIGSLVLTALAPQADPAISVDYSDGILTVKYDPAIPANQTVLRVCTPAEFFFLPDRPLIERFYDARAFSDTVDLRARAEPIYTVVVEEIDPAEHRYHYWTFRDMGVNRMLGIR